MIGSLFKEFSPERKDDSPESGSNYAVGGDDAALIAALPVAQNIARGKARSSWFLDAAEIVQRVAVRLLGWRQKNPERSAALSTEDWKSIAATTTYNEFRRDYRDNPTYKESSIDEAIAIASPKSVEGESTTELQSLVRAMWTAIIDLSLQQRRALILHELDIVVYFLQCGVDESELLNAIDVSATDWIALSETLPLKDLQIAERWPKAGKTAEQSAKLIKKARFDARAKLRSVIEK